MEANIFFAFLHQVTIYSFFSGDQIKMDYKWCLARKEKINEMLSLLFKPTSSRQIG